MLLPANAQKKGPHWSGGLIERQPLSATCARSKSQAERLERLLPSASLRCKSHWWRCQGIVIVTR
jgi:hypothetical protein